MTSGFSYKGIDIYKITDNKGNKVPGYNFIGTATKTDSTGLRPLPFGLTYQGTPVSNYCSAPKTDILTAASGNVTIPTGCKSIAFYGIGGGGGGGGGGGNANVKVVGGRGNNRSGGAGGSGVTAGYISAYQIPTAGESSISYTIGRGGNAGNNGGNSARSVPAGKSMNAKGGDGGAGNEGGETIITMGASKYKTNKAPGGNGGNGANVNYKGTAFRDETNGGNGNTPDPNTTPSTAYNANVNFPPLIGYGNGGGGGGNGSNGAIQIIWLYD
jgi:hypothetical protein